MPRTRTFLAITALLAAVACGDDSSGPGEPVNMTGTWSTNGNLSTGQAFVFMMTLTQTDANVTGTGEVVGLISSGTITGTVSGGRFTYQFAITQPCTATFTGTADVNGRNISGNIGGMSTCLGTVQATYSGLRQAAP